MLDQFEVRVDNAGGGLVLDVVSRAHESFNLLDLVHGLLTVFLQFLIINL